MMNYKVKKTENGHGVYENSTQQYIEVKESAKAAREIAKHMNLGAGFDGFTPNFITKSVKGVLERCQKQN